MSLRSKATIIAALAGLVIGATTSYAMAAAAISPWRNWSSYVNDCRNRSLVDTGISRTETHRVNSGETLAGRMGTQGRTYWDDGPMCSSTVWRYNTEPARVHITRYSNGCGGWIYSQGASRTWDGSGYGTYPSFRTPNYLS